MGFTPAYAGKIGELPPCSSACRVHPRIRGEDRAYALNDLQVLGSPPHTRGRFCYAAADIQGKRFTPAYAGKIITWRYCSRSHQVHPRIRGEDLPVPKSPVMMAGSPPHTRGRWISCFPSSLILRFTPAYAGKIITWRYCSRSHQVHPRIRGEDLPVPKSPVMMAGSPPHTRGRSGFFDVHL